MIFSITDESHAKRWLEERGVYHTIKKAGRGSETILFSYSGEDEIAVVSYTQGHSDPNENGFSICGIKCEPTAAGRKAASTRMLPFIFEAFRGLGPNFELRHVVP